MPPSAEAVVTQAMTALEQDDIPPILRERIDQHQRNLRNLAAALLEGGQDIVEVQRTVEGVFDSFKAELVKTIIRLREDAHAV